MRAWEHRDTRGPVVIIPRSRTYPNRLVMLAASATGNRPTVNGYEPLKLSRRVIITWRTNLLIKHPRMRTFFEGQVDTQGLQSDLCRFHALYDRVTSG